MVGERKPIQNSASKVTGGTTQIYLEKATFPRNRGVSNLTPFIWEDNFHFLVEIYTHKPHPLTPRKGLLLGEYPAITDPSASCGRGDRGV